MNFLLGSCFLDSATFKRFELNDNLRVGGIIDPEGLTYHDIESIAKRYEELGFDSAMIFDHFFPIHSSDDTPYLECWTTLSALARATSKIKIGPLVTCTSYRHPALLAKVSTAVDRISSGRLIFGVGMGWYKKEYEMYGFSAYSDRVRLFKETMKIVKSLWENNETSFDGKYFRLDRAVNFPKPISRPHPPILVGSEKGKEKSLGLVSEFADIANIGWNFSPEEMKLSLDTLREKCLQSNRPFSELEISTNFDLLLGESSSQFEQRKNLTWKQFKVRYPDIRDYEAKIRTGFSGTPKEIIPTLRKMREIGVNYFFIHPMGLPNLDSIELFADQVLDQF